MMRGLCSQLAALLLLLPSAAHGAEESQNQPVFSRIIGGKNAQAGRWPWQVSVQEYGFHICGGSLISAQWVVSAAHCFNSSLPYSQYRLVLGAHQLLNPSPNQILVNVKQIILHPHYNNKTFVADIALVRLEKTVKSTKFIRPISLPGAFRKFPEKMKCWVTGWGRVQMNQPLPRPMTLQELEVPIINTAVCNDRYNTLRPHSPLGPQAVKPSMICAGYMNRPKGFCKGDSGGPLACQQGSTWYLAGVVSWFLTRNMNGIIFSEFKFPGVFTRVTTYNSWIRRQVNGTTPLPASLPLR